MVIKTYEINVNGELKTLKISEISKMIGISPRTYSSRIESGLTPQEAFDLKPRRAKRYNFTFNGKYFENKSAKEISEISNLDYTYVKKNIAEGIEINKIVSDGQNVRRGPIKLYSFDFKGANYDNKSIPEISKITGINIATLRYRIKRGINIQEIVNGNFSNYRNKKYGMSFSLDGKDYTNLSLSQASKITGLTKDKLKLCINCGEDIQSFILEEIRIKEEKELLKKEKNKNKDNKPSPLYSFSYKGENYNLNTVSALSKVIKISKPTISKKLKEGCSLEEILEYAEEIKIPTYDVIIDGKEYKGLNLISLSKVSGIGRETLRSRIKKYGSAQKAIDLGEGRAKTKYFDFYYKGKEYKNKRISEISKITNITIPSINARLKTYGDIQKAIEMKVKNKVLYFEFNYNGKSYTGKTLDEISKIVGIKKVTLYKRISQDGLSIQDAVNKETHKLYKPSGFNKEMKLKEIISYFGITALGINLSKFDDIDMAIDFSLINKNKYRDSENNVYEFKSEYEKELFINGEISADDISK